MPNISDPTLEIHDGSRALRVVVRFAATGNVLQVRLLPPLRGKRSTEPQLVIGDHQLPLEGEPRCLVQGVPGGHRLLLREGMQGRVRLESGEELPLQQVRGADAAGSTDDDGVVAYDVPRDAVIDLELGPYALELRSEPPPRPLRRRQGLLGFIERRDRLSHAGSLALHATLLLLALLVPPTASSLSRDHFDRLDVWKPKQPPRRYLLGAWAATAPPRFTAEGGSGRRAGESEGRMGTPEGPRRPALFALRGPRTNPDPHLARDLALAAVQNEGLLRTLGGTNSQALRSVFGAEDAVGYDARTALGALIGNRIGEAYGVGGLGLMGTGRGGGAPNDSEHVGLGAMGTVGRGTGVGRGAGYARGAGQLVGYNAGGPLGIHAGRARVVGAMDKSIIRRVIRRHLNEWRYCYERELQGGPPGLGGRVVLQFTIASTGLVLSSSVQSSTVGNPRVEQCIARAVRRWRFPAARGGGLVHVRYPVVLRVAGD